MRGTRVAITLVFFADGLLIGSWAARIPAVQRHAGLTNTQLGLALFAMSLGALVAMPLAGWLVRADRQPPRHASPALRRRRRVALRSPRSPPVSPGSPRRSLAFGAGFGAVNVSANAQGLALERRYGRPILSSFHAAFSAGGLAGAGARRARGGASASAPRAHFGGVALVARCWCASSAARRLLPPDGGDGPPTPILVRPPRALLVLGAAAFFTLLAEGAAADWSAVYLSHSLGATAAVAALGYTGFSLAMATSRAVGDRLNGRFGPVALARGGGLLAAVRPRARARRSARLPPRSSGFAAMGAGLGVVVPVLFRAAGSTPGVSGRRRRRGGLDDRLARLPRRARPRSASPPAPSGCAPRSASSSSRARRAGAARAERERRPRRVASAASSSSRAPCSPTSTACSSTRAPRSRRPGALRRTARARPRARARAEPRPPQRRPDPPRRAAPRRRGGGRRLERDEIERAPRPAARFPARASSSRRCRPTASRS